MYKYQLITSPSGEEMVVISKTDFDAIMAALVGHEDDTDIAIYDARKANLTERSNLPHEVSLAILRGASRLQAIREYQGLSLGDVARMANKTDRYVADLESGRRSVSGADAQGLAAVLDVPIEWVAE